VSIQDLFSRGQGKDGNSLSTPHNKGARPSEKPNLERSGELLIEADEEEAMVDRYPQTMAIRNISKFNILDSLYEASLKNFGK